MIIVGDLLVAYEKFGPENVLRYNKGEERKLDYGHDTEEDILLIELQYEGVDDIRIYAFAETAAVGESAVGQTGEETIDEGEKGYAPLSEIL